jgi:hypothetical protein
MFLQICWGSLSDFRQCIYMQNFHSVANYVLLMFSLYVYKLKIRRRLPHHNFIEVPPNCNRFDHSGTQKHDNYSWHELWPSHVSNGYADYILCAPITMFVQYMCRQYFNMFIYIYIHLHVMNLGWITMLPRFFPVYITHPIMHKPRFFFQVNGLILSQG